MSTDRLARLALAGLLAAMSLPMLPSPASAEPDCVYIDQADPHSRMWLDDDGALVTERLGNVVRYPTSTGGGTGIMTRIYRPEDPKHTPQPILFVDLSEIAKAGAPTTLVVAFGNVYMPECRAK